VESVTAPGIVRVVTCARTKLNRSAIAYIRRLLVNYLSVLMHAFPSLQRRGGCGINKKSRSHRSAADGVVSSAKCLGLRFRRTDHPVRAFSEGDHFFAARPPLLCKEGNKLA